MAKSSSDLLKALIESVDKKYTMFKDLLQQFYYQCSVKNLSQITIRGYGDRLTSFYQFLKKRNIPFESVNRSTIEEYVLSLKDRVSDYTVNGRIRVLKLFFNYLVTEGLWDNGNPMEKIKFTKTERKIKPILTPEGIEKLLAVPNKRTFWGYRNFCIILVFWDTLIRLSELINIRLDDVDLKDGLLKVYGKGRKERIVPLGAKTIKSLHYYLIKHRNQIESEYLFCTSRGKPLDQRNVQRILERIGRRVGIHVSSHLIRHSAATWWIREGAQPMYLQNLMGHTSMSVTQKYINLANVDELKKHHAKYSPADNLRLS